MQAGRQQSLGFCQVFSHQDVLLFKGKVPGKRVEHPSRQKRGQWGDSIVSKWEGNTARLHLEAWKASLLGTESPPPLTQQFCQHVVRGS